VAGHEFLIRGRETFGSIDGDAVTVKPASFSAPDALKQLLADESGTISLAAAEDCGAVRAAMRVRTKITKINAPAPISMTSLIDVAFSPSHKLPPSASGNFAQLRQSSRAAGHRRCYGSSSPSHYHFLPDLRKNRRWAVLLLIPPDSCSVDLTC
jgi:hypothetical protein